MALERYRQKRNFKTTPEPRGHVSRAARRRRCASSSRSTRASHLHYDFRLELERRAAELGRAQGPEPRSERQAARHARRGPSARIRRLRRHDPAQAVRRGHGDAVGSRHVDPEGGSGRGLSQGPAQVRARRREAARRLDARPQPRRQVRRQRQELAADQGERRVRAAGAEGAHRRRRARTASRRAQLDEIALDRDRGTIPIACGNSNGSGRGERASTGAARSARKRCPHSTSQRSEGARKDALPATVIEPELATLVEGAPTATSGCTRSSTTATACCAASTSGEVHASISRNGKEWTGSSADRRTRAAAAGRRRAHGSTARSSSLERDGRPAFRRCRTRCPTERAAQPALLRLRSAVPRRLRPARRAAHRAQAPAARAACRVATATLRYSDHIARLGRRVLRAGLHAEARRHDLQARRFAYRGGARPRLAQGQVQPAAGDGDRRLHRSRRAAARLRRAAARRVRRDGNAALPGQGRAPVSTTRRSRRCTRDARQARAAKTPPFINPPRGYEAKGAHWVKPELVAEIAFTEWTNDGTLRHPSFRACARTSRRQTWCASARTPATTSKRERTAMPSERRGAAKVDASANAPRSSHAATRQLARLKLGSSSRDNARGQARARAEHAATSSPASSSQHPDKLLYPEASSPSATSRVTTRRSASGSCRTSRPSADAGALSQRLEQAVLLPEACRQERQRRDRARRKFPRATAARPTLHDGEFGRRAASRWCRWASLELHPWGSSAPKLRSPGPPDLRLRSRRWRGWEALVEAVHLLQDAARGARAQGFLKTTGGKGLHVVVPIEPTLDWDADQGFTKAIAELHGAHVSRSLHRDARRRRSGKGKIFVDYLRNAEGATAIAPIRCAREPMRRSRCRSRGTSWTGRALRVFQREERARALRG